MAASKAAIPMRWQMMSAIFSARVFSSVGVITGKR